MCNFKTIAWRIHSHLIKSLSKIGPPTPHILAPPWPNIGSWGYFINKSEMYSYMYYLAVILFSQLQLQPQFSSEKLFSIYGSWEEDFYDTPTYFLSFLIIYPLEKTQWPYIFKKFWKPLFQGCFKKSLVEFGQGVL